MSAQTAASSPLICELVISCPDTNTAERGGLYALSLQGPKYGLYAFEVYGQECQVMHKNAGRDGGRWDDASDGGV